MLPACPPQTDVLSLVGGPSILTELQAIKQQQALLTSSLDGIQRDNQAMWQEMIASRQRLQRQQQTTMKILQFLASVYVKDKASNLRPSPGRLLLCAAPPVASGAGAAAGVAADHPSVADEAHLGPAELLHEPSAVVTPSGTRTVRSPATDRDALIPSSSSPLAPASPGSFDPDEIQRHILELMSPEVGRAPGAGRRGSAARAPQ